MLQFRNDFRKTELYELTVENVSSQPRRFSPSVNRSKPSLVSSFSSVDRMSFCFFEILVSLRSALLRLSPFIFGEVLQ